MQDPNADFFERLDRCIEHSDVEAAWQNWMARQGYGRSSIQIFSWQSGNLEVIRENSNWHPDLLEDYYRYGYYRFDPIANPLRKSLSFAASHIDNYSLAGRSKEASDFVDWVHSLAFPGQASVVITVAQGLRLAFTGFSEDNERLFGILAKETQDNIRLAAHACATRYMQLSLGAVFPNDSPLSPRELECLLWLAKGHRTTEIAERLGISSKTVDFHLAGARQKLNAKTSLQAVVISVMNKYIQP